jgi:hypothetical protein
LVGEVKLAHISSFFQRGKSTALLPVIVILLFLSFAGTCSSRQTYTEETIDGVRHIHNMEPLWEEDQRVELEFIRKFGDSDTDDERHLFYYPADVAVDGEGYILILDAGNHKVKKFDSDGNYISSFGRKGAGPGEFIGPNRMDVGSNGDILVNDRANNVVNIFDRSGSFVRRINNEGLSPTDILALRSGEIAIFYVRRFSSDSNQQAPSLVNVHDRNGNIIRAFASPRIYEDPATNFWCNSIGIASDGGDNVYVNFESQNRIEKYSADGKLLFRADRLLGYPETLAIEKKVQVYDQGPLIAVSFNRFSAGIQIDHKGRIWSGTLLRQKDPDDQRSGDDAPREGGRHEDYMFEIYDSDGILLGRIQEEAYSGQRFRIAGDRLFLVDKDVEMTVSEYRIVDK